MDPNACLQRFRAAVAEGDYEEATDARGDLLTWIQNGGFEPKWGPGERETVLAWALPTGLRGES